MQGMGRHAAGLLVLGALALGLAPGCHHARDPFRLNERRIQNLLHQASVASSCPAVAMTYERISDRVFRVSGCGTYVDFGAFARGRGRYTSGRWVRIASITERAPMDLACPAASCSFAAAGPLAYVVSGCGRTGSFEMRCGDQDCAWIPTSITGAPAAAPVVAAPVAVTPQIVVVPQVVPAPPPDASGSVRAAIAAARASVLACSGGQPVTAQLAWDGAGHLALGLAPPFGGTSVETCVAGVVGSAQITGLTVPGTAVVTIQ